jgi:SHS2 domain-containing protein
VHEWVDHTSELELRIEAASPEEAFAEAMVALGELLDGNAGGAADEHEISVSAPDRATLLAEWLNELVFLAETRGFVPTRIERVSLGETVMDATVAGIRGGPRPLVKAVTYHRLELTEIDDAWRARVIFDV